ncbi:hypothetical protein QBC47DRAFT_172172 [Echria macrotheca]|uniref:Uncharacterized protein n=1 Tax=Echria macrotheca TaxID=438768 RepID=A0AAJ0BHF3_9PEZI|nr:hypothetical protein QBC47DRAFT_172172 [Echria macrotheca]
MAEGSVSAVVLLRRDDSKLDTGAIAGIACAAGALFLGGIGLFIIYYRRQRQYARQHGGGRLRSPLEENHGLAAYSPPIYTHDYKMSHTLESATLGGSGSSAQTFSPEFHKEGVFFSPGEPTSVSAMPTHPAYIPRALVRQTPPSSQTIPLEEETPRPQIALQPAPKKPRTKGTKSRPDDLVMQAFLRVADGERVPSEVFRLADEDEGGKDYHQLVPPTNANLQQPEQQHQTTIYNPLPLRSSPRNSPGSNNPPLNNNNNSRTQNTTFTTSSEHPRTIPGLATGTLTRPQPSPPRPGGGYPGQGQGRTIETGTPPFQQPHPEQIITVHRGDTGISQPLNTSPPLPILQGQYASPIDQQQPHHNFPSSTRGGGYPAAVPGGSSSTNAPIGDNRGHRRDNSTSRRIGDWIAGQQPKGPRGEQRFPTEVVPAESDVWG